MATDVQHSQPARRLRKPGWRDPRLIVGILLVIGAVAGVLTLLSWQNKTVPVYVASQDISMGEKIEASGLDVVDVRLDSVQDQYLTARQAPSEDLRANTLIRSGELVPLASLGGRDPQNRKPLSVELSRDLPVAVAVGTRVDVWAAERAKDSTTYQEPKKLLETVEVSAIRELDSGFGGVSGQVVELLVTDEDLPGMISALANEAQLTVVFAGGGSAG
ncbi:MAG: hypothetical protein ACTHWW_01640 [Arthrobacter sp.]|uniref:hypothetical protein n=1 Tax=unclassified Arthrobacter TaxID=235627 RepID=UPI00265365C6|nr:hypothetical protein [Micrococcaceae bacterium]MDN5813359.1 hypothetical protein [Micrococcaceae bacterium]MDN5825410.1 hypothetical protein [Micrococcaceae bacterium]MDN5879390.1 hypothetical protein [Micrococcaceae bacterium]MDN5905172.1 hypothetical protein [Micrococcaceae bacterium]